MRATPQTYFPASNSLKFILLLAWFWGAGAGTLCHGQAGLKQPNTHGPLLAAAETQHNTFFHSYTESGSTPLRGRHYYAYQGAGSSEPGPAENLEIALNSSTSEGSAAEKLSLQDKINKSFAASPIKVKLLISILIYLSISLFVLFGWIIINRTVKSKRREQAIKIKQRYQEQLATLLFDDETQTIEFRGISHPVNRQIFIDECRALHANLHGEAAITLRDLYFNLNLHRDSLEKINSSKWNIKAKGFRELAQMDVKDANHKIAPYINDKNAILRIEAQIAMVKLSEDNPMRFLDELETELSQWEQINIYDTLIYHQINIESWEPWLNVPNESVSIFAIRMIGLFKHVQSAPKVAELLDHPNPLIRNAAVKTLGQFEMPEYIDPLKALFEKESQRLQEVREKEKNRKKKKDTVVVVSLHDLPFVKNRKEIIHALTSMITKDDIPFLSNIALDWSNDFELRMLTARLIASIGKEGIQHLDYLMANADEELRSMITNIKNNLA